MKQLTLLLLLICTGSAVFGQASKRCWNFETQCPHPENSFYTLCIYDAHSASGSPDTKSDYVGITAYEGSKYAHMYARYCPEGLSRNHGEGIILKYDFTAGKSYTLKFAYRSPLPPSETKILLATNMPNFGGIPSNGGGCTDYLDILPAITAGNTLIGTITPGANWQVATLTFTPNANFNQIWIRPQQNGSPDQGVVTSDLYVDDVCVKETCDPDQYTVNLCQYYGATDLVATINGVSVPQGQWRLWHANDCNGGTNTNNLGAQVPIEWISNNSFTLPDNSGCYVLAYIFQQTGCGAAKLVRVLINTDADNIPFCTKPCVLWDISVAEDYCKVVYFYAVPFSEPFPAGTIASATINGNPVSLDLPYLVRYFPYLGESHWIKVCFTIQEPGCPEFIQCYDYFVDCAEIVGDPKETDRSEAHTDIVKKDLSVTNPSTSLIRFSRTVEHGIAQLYTVQGALIQSTVLDQANQLDVNTVSAGQYILAIQEATGVTTRLVFIINK